MTTMTRIAANGLDLLAHQIRHVRACVDQTGKGQMALKRFLARRRAIIKRFRLAPFLVRSAN